MEGSSAESQLSAAFCSPKGRICPGTGVGDIPSRSPVASGLRAQLFFRHRRTGTDSRCLCLFPGVWHPDPFPSCGDFHHLCPYDL